VLVREGRDPDDEFVSVSSASEPDGPQIELVIRPGSRVWKDMLVVLVQTLRSTVPEVTSFEVTDLVSGRSQRIGDT